MKEFITYRGVEFEVEFEFFPPEPARSNCPSVDPSINIIDISYEGEDWTEILEPRIAEIEELVWATL